MTGGKFEKFTNIKKLNTFLKTSWSEESKRKLENTFR